MANHAHTGTVEVCFTSAGVTVHAQPGTNIYEVAEQAGIDTITLGCCSGNCGICEVSPVVCYLLV